MRRRAKVDSNEIEIVNRLRDKGYVVYRICGRADSESSGVPDLVVAYSIAKEGKPGIVERSETILLEIKDGEKPPSQRKLADNQLVFGKTWPGRYAVVLNVKEALDACEYELLKTRGINVQKNRR